MVKFPLAIWLVVVLIISFVFQSSYSIFGYIGLVLVLMFQKKNYISPMLYLLVPWGFMLSMFFSTTIVYTQKTDNIIPILYLLLCLALIWGGYGFGGQFRFRSSKKYNADEGTEYSESRSLISFVTWLSIISILGSVLSIYELLFVAGLDMTSLNSMRTSYVSRETGIFSQLGNILSWGCLVSVPGFFFFSKKQKKGSSILWLAALGLFLIQNVLSAGRQSVFSIALMMLSCFMVKISLSTKINSVAKRKRKKEKKKQKRYLIILLVAAIAYMMFVATARTNRQLASSRLGELEYYFGFTFCSWMEEFLSILPVGMADGIAEMIVYFTHQVPEFTIFWDIPMIGPFLGLYSMPFIDRRLSFLNLSAYDMAAKMEYVRSYMQSQGVMPVGWRTAFSYYLLDYGKIGTLLFCFLLGVYAKNVYRSYNQERTYFNTLRLVVICVYMCYTVMMPVTCETAWLLLIIFANIMPVIEKRYPRLKYTIK